MAQHVGPSWLTKTKSPIRFLTGGSGHTENQIEGAKEANETSAYRIKIFKNGSLNEKTATSQSCVHEQQAFTIIQKSTPSSALGF